MPTVASPSRIARTWFVGRQDHSIAARGSTSVDAIGPVVRIRSRSSSTSAACSSKVATWPARLRSQVTRYQGSSAVGTIDSILLYVSYSTRSRYRRSSVHVRRYPAIREFSVRSWLRPATSIGSNWSDPRRSTTRMTEAGSGGSERGGARRWRATRNRRAAAAGTDRMGWVTGSIVRWRPASGCQVRGPQPWRTARARGPDGVTRGSWTSVRAHELHGGEAGRRRCQQQRRVVPDRLVDDGERGEVRRLDGRHRVLAGLLRARDRADRDCRPVLRVRPARRVAPRVALELAVRERGT